MVDERPAPPGSLELHTSRLLIEVRSGHRLVPRRPATIADIQAARLLPDGGVIVLGEHSLAFDTSSEVIKLLDELLASGFYGSRREEVAERLLLDRLLELIKRKQLELLQSAVFRSRDGPGMILGPCAMDGCPNECLPDCDLCGACSARAEDGL